MSDPTSSSAPAVTWRVRVIRRVAGSVGAAVVIAGVAPAVANAAGAGVPNPVAIALRASGRGIQSAFGASSTESSVVACEPSAEPVESSAAPDEVVTSESVSAEPTVAPSETPSEIESAAPSETPSAEPSVEPSSEPSAEPSVEPTGATESPAACESPSPTATPSATESVTPEVTESESEDGTHGQIVSTVAKCAPRGKDPLLDVEGAPANHGAFVKPAAHGDTLTTPWGTFDLSTQAGADQLCAAVAAARDALPSESPSVKGKGKGDKEHGKPDRDKGAKANGKGGKKS